MLSDEDSVVSRCCRATHITGTPAVPGITTGGSRSAYVAARPDAAVCRTIVSEVSGKAWGNRGAALTS